MAPRDEATSIRRTLVSRLKVRQLALLQSIERHSTLSHVAREMRLSQPAITKALKEAETVFGTALFTRSSRGLVPTTAGKMILLYANRWLADLDGASQSLAAIDAGRGGRIRLGITAQVARALIRAALSELLGQSPRISVSVVEGTTDQLVARMLAGELDCAVGRLYDGDAPGVAQEVISEQEPCIVVSARQQKRLSDMPLDWRRLVELDWILPPRDTPMRRLYNSVFVAAGVPPPTPIVETTSVRTMETVLAFEANAIAILPLEVVNELFATGAAVPLKYRLEWKLPPIAFLSIGPLDRQPQMRRLADALHHAAGEANRSSATGRSARS
jgi:DNA-binding transcriptional LysR family regulator